MSKPVDENLKQYATARQWEIYQAVQEHGSNKKAAEKLKVGRRVVDKSMVRLKTEALNHGYSPEHDIVRPVPDGMKLQRLSDMRENSLGKPIWYIFNADKERQAEMMEKTMKAMAKDLPQVKPVAGPEETLPHLMAVYPIGDAHIGMHAWGEETQGEDWDMKESVRVQCGAMASLVDLAPAAEEGVIINLGDWMHADNMAGTTSRSGHSMDMAGRYGQMIEVAVMVMRQCIASALKRHRTVRVINVIGNHDDTGAAWMALNLRHTYENEPRVIVDKDPTAFHYIEHGKVLIGTHHGHTCKPAMLPGVMAADQAKAWGRTEHRYWYLGHVHHQSVKEYAGVTVESFNTLTAKDAYAAFGGYRARQNMKCIVLHDQYGEVARHTVSPEMLEDAA